MRKPLLRLSYAIGYFFGDYLPLILLIVIAALISLIAFSCNEAMIARNQFMKDCKADGYAEWVCIVFSKTPERYPGPLVNPTSPAGR